MQEHIESLLAPHDNRDKAGKSIEAIRTNDEELKHQYIAAIFRKVSGHLPRIAERSAVAGRIALTQN